MNNQFLRRLGCWLPALALMLCASACTKAPESAAGSGAKLDLPVISASAPEGSGKPEAAPESSGSPVSGKLQGPRPGKTGKPDSIVYDNSLIGGICQLIAGIKGVKHCKNSERSKNCMVWGIVVVAFAILGGILNIINSAKFDVLSFVTGLIVPALYIYGAILNSKADDTQPAA